MDQPDKTMLIQLEDVGFRYPSDSRDHWVLQSLNFAFVSGEMIRLDGRNGAGKSTFLQLLADIFQPVRGSIVRHVETARIIYLNQNPADFLGESLTVQEQLRVGAFDQQEAALSPGTLAYTLLAQFGVALEARTNSFTTELSGGQRQILALVCVLLAHPLLLILDEFTAYMDESSVSTACELVTAFARQNPCSVIFVDQTGMLPLRPSRVISMSTTGEN